MSEKKVETRPQHLKKSNSFGVKKTNLVDDGPPNKSLYAGFQSSSTCWATYSVWPCGLHKT